LRVHLMRSPSDRRIKSDHPTRRASSFGSVQHDRARLPTRTAKGARPELFGNGDNIIALVCDWSLPSPAPHSSTAGMDRVVEKIITIATGPSVVVGWPSGLLLLSPAVQPNGHTGEAGGDMIRFSDTNSDSFMPACAPVSFFACQIAAIPSDPRN